MWAVDIVQDNKDTTPMSFLEQRTTVYHKMYDTLNFCTISNESITMTNTISVEFTVQRSGTTEMGGLVIGK